MYIVYISAELIPHSSSAGIDKPNIESDIKQHMNKASQAIQSPRTVLFFLLISLLDGYSFANVHIKGIVAFKH